MGTIGYLAFSVDGPVASTPAQPISENRETPPVDSVVAREEAETAGTLLMGQDTEMVFGIEVRKDRTCTLVERYVELEDGTLQRGIQCVPAEKEPGPYDHYGNETLEGMSYADAEAAAELAQRWAYDYPEEARRLALRAVALDSSNVMPIETLAWNQYSQDYDENGVATEVVREGYVLLRTAEVIKGAPVMDADRSRDLLVQAGYTNEHFAALEVRVSMEVGFIRDTQLELLGETTISRGNP